MTIRLYKPSIAILLVEMLHQAASRTGRKQVSVFLITKDVGVVIHIPFTPGNVKASASCYNSGR